MIVRVHTNITSAFDFAYINKSIFWKDAMPHYSASSFLFCDAPFFCTVCAIQSTTPQSQMTPPQIIKYNGKYVQVSAISNAPFMSEHIVTVSTPALIRLYATRRGILVGAKTAQNKNGRNPSTNGNNAAHVM